MKNLARQTHKIEEFIDSIIIPDEGRHSGIAISELAHVMTANCYHAQYLRTSYVDHQGGNESRPFNSAVN